MHNKVDVLPSYEKAVRDLNEPPPPYTANTGTVLPVVNGMDNTSSDVPTNDDGRLRDSLKSICRHFAANKLATFIATFFLLLTSLSMAALIVGAREHPNCPENRNPAIWLIVFGVMGLVECWAVVILVIGRTVIGETHRRRCKIALILVIIFICLFSFGWGMAGIVWATVSTSTTTRANHCDPSVQSFGQGLSIFLLTVGCCVFGCLGG